MKLEGHTVLITGGSGGIGYELARQLVQRGNTVIVTGRDSNRLQRAKKGLPELHTIQSDVSQSKDIDSLYEQVTRQFPKLDVLVNNAGVMRALNIQAGEQSLEKFTQEININLLGPIWMVKRFLPHLKAQREPAVINVSSGLAFVPLPVFPVYCATKAAVHSFSLSLRAQLKKTPIRVFELMPPATRTDLFADADARFLEGVSLMGVEDMVQECIRGIERDKLEIRPGQSNSLRLMDRLAPNFIQGQLSKTVNILLEGSG
jgi:uncharacterized oxidoreductase